MKEKRKHEILYEDHRIQTSHGPGWLPACENSHFTRSETSKLFEPKFLTLPPRTMKCLLALKFVEYHALKKNNGTRFYCT